MNKDQKQVLRAIGTMVVVKAVIYGTIAYAARSLRKANEKIDPDGHFVGYALIKGTDRVAGHPTIEN